MFSGPVREDEDLEPDVLLDLLDLNGQGVLVDDTPFGQMRSSDKLGRRLDAGRAAHRLATAMELHEMDHGDLDRATVQLHRRLV